MADEVIISVPEQYAIKGEDGFSPVVNVTQIAHGHEVTITDALGDHQFNVMDGASAYEQAVAGGYEGTEAQFNAELAAFKDLSEQAASAATTAASSATAAANSATAAAASATAAGNAQAAAEAAQTAAVAAKTATEAARDTAISTLQTEGAAQKTAIQQKGAEVIASIPEDYTDLTEDVSDLKSALTANFGFEYTTAPGYITASGGISSAGSSTQEVYSTLMPVYEGQQLRFILAPTTGQSMWMTIAYYRESGTFISRKVLVENSTVSGGITTDHTIEGAETAYIRVTWRTYGYAEVILYDISYKATIADIYGKIGGLEDDLKISETVEIPWEAGNIYMTPTQIYYNMSSGDKRIRTPQNFVLSLNAGDTISLPPDNTVNMYVGWKKPNGEYAYVGWISQSYTATLDTDYYLLAAFNPERVLESVDELSQYLTVTRNSTVKTELEQLDSRVGALESAVDHGMDVPDYFTENLDDAITAAQTAMLPASINGETFVFLSDIHWENNEKHSPALVKAVTDALPIENTIFCGDTFNGGTQETVVGYMNDVRKRFTAASPHFLSVYGNHDGNQLDGGTAFAHNEFYTLMQKQADYYVKYEAPCYYYMDNEATKTRFVFLDSRTGTPSTASAQIAWLQTITNSAPTGWHFIVFCHVIYYPNSGGSYSDPSTWIMSPFMTNVCTELDAVNTTGGKKVEAVFGGHCHMDYNSQTSGGIPIVLIDCDTKQTVSGNPQTPGTIGEQCLDIVTVDYSAEKIYCTRIGRGASRTISY